jgi:hypothetical protein
VPQTFLLALLLSGSVQLVATSYVGLPSFAAEVPALVLVPPAAGLLLASPLVDQMPELTLRAGRPLGRVLLLRYATTQIAGAIVVASLALTGWTFERSLVVVLFLAGSAVAASALGPWHWVPVMGASYGWLLRSQHLDDLADADIPVAAAAAGLVLAGAVYVAAGCYRVHRSRCPPGRTVSPSSRRPRR